MSETQPEVLRDRTFSERSLKASRFVNCDLRDVVVRGSLVTGMEVDSPWLIESGGPFLVNGVDVVPMVDAELNRRFPGRELRRADDPEGLRRAWAAVERTWAATIDRVASMPAGLVDASVDDEWSVAQTLRHLVMATDTWLGRAILGLEHPYHPAGLQNDDGESAAFDESDFSLETPSFDEVLEARASRQAMVRDFLVDATPELLAQSRTNPHDPESDHRETVLSCLHTILEEEWEHHRYTTRDLDTLATRATTSGEAVVDRLAP